MLKLNSGKDGPGNERNMYAAGDSDDDFEDDEAMAMQMQEQYDANFWIE